MFKNKSKLFTLVLGLLWNASITAQESIVISGGNANGSSGSVSYSIVNFSPITNTGSGGSMSQGVQHAYEIYTLGIKETLFDISLHVFPNPTAENIFLLIKNYKGEKFYYQLYNVLGNLIEEGNVISQQTIIQTSALNPSTYFILLLNKEKQKIQTYKIIKK